MKDALKLLQRYRVLVGCRQRKFPLYARNDAEAIAYMQDDFKARPLELWRRHDETNLTFVARIDS